MRWLYLHFPDLALELGNGGLVAEQPQACLDKENLISSLNKAAADAGLQQGMRLSTALALCPVLEQVSVSPLQLHQGLQALAQAAYDLAGPLSLAPPSGLLIELSSMQRLYGSDQALLACLHDNFQKLGHQLCSGIGATPLAARLLAEVDMGPLPLESGWEMLRSLSLCALGLPVNLNARLQRAGLRQIGQLLDLPRMELGKRYGATLLSVLGRLEGSLKEARQLYHPPEGFERQLIFNHEVSQAQALLFPLSAQLQALALFLEKRQLACSQLQLTLYFRAQEPLELTLRGAEPLWRHHDWRDIAQLQLEKLRLDAPAVAIALQAQQFSPRAPGNNALFEPSRPNEPLLGRLITRLGEQAIQGICLNENHCPEEAFLWVRPGENCAVKPQKALRPLWLLPSPEPLDDAPDIIRGPERLASGWWQNSISRDYFIARHPQGGLCWTFKDKEERWYLHGWFG
ncbi:Y-family DNA polymerase [Gallaecimonas pentaromativorans]|uniref:Protein ImuB n=1 Tax=Gallaecimonas pentaromativorans TaxID=584787 RepID=A0A3N1PAI7_9GAMM|nr:DNA polymerase Y family protein [Gallaecimonas pentaromativorans]ROQ25059.1 protein ImuB [Gallaecimonas pentaromativorans]